MLVIGGGTIVLVGIIFNRGKIDYSPVWAQEVDLAGINCHTTAHDGRSSFDVAAALLLAGHLDPALLLTHRFPMAQ